MRVWLLCLLAACGEQVALIGYLPVDASDAVVDSGTRVEDSGIPPVLEGGCVLLPDLVVAYSEPFLDGDQVRTTRVQDLRCTPVDAGAQQASYVYERLDGTPIVLGGRGYSLRVPPPEYNQFVGITGGKLFAGGDWCEGGQLVGALEVGPLQHICIELRPDDDSALLRLEDAITIGLGNLPMVLCEGRCP